MRAPVALYGTANLNATPVSEETGVDVRRTQWNCVYICYQDLLLLIAPELWLSSM